MAGASIRPRARLDLEEIWEYTVDFWGLPQADEYLTKISRHFETLAENPALGRNCDHVRQGYRVYPSGQHLISYKEIPAGIDVIRVLHKRMDAPQHLV